MAGAGEDLFRPFSPAAASPSTSASATSAGRRQPSNSLELPLSRGPFEVLPQGRHYRAYRPDDVSRRTADVSTQASATAGGSSQSPPGATSGASVASPAAPPSAAGQAHATDTRHSSIPTPAAAHTVTGHTHRQAPTAAPEASALAGSAASAPSAAASTSGGARPKLRMRKGEKGAPNEYQAADHPESQGSASYSLALDPDTLLSKQPPSSSSFPPSSEQYSIEHSIQHDPRLQWVPQAVRMLCAALVLLFLWLVAAVVQLHSVAHGVALLNGVPVGSLAATNWGVPWRQVHASCNSREQEELHRLLKGIVLIVNADYKDATRGTSDFLRAVYGRFFYQVVVISQTDIPDIGVEARGPKLYRSLWMFAYFHLPKVMAAHPTADGYLWTNDDVALNYWRLRDADKNKLWMFNNLSSAESKFFPFDQGTQAQFEDGWAGTRESRDKAWNAFRNLDDKYQQGFKNSLLPLRDVFPKRLVDVFYIPKRFAHAVSFDLIPIFREYKVWQEVAIPMMFYALDEPKNFDPIFNDMKVVWDRDEYDAKRDWSPQVSCVHPWKLSENSSRIEFLRTLGSYDRCLLQLLPMVTKPSH